MKKYYLSHVDFSEIVNVTTDESRLSRARDRMKQLRMLTDKGKPSVSSLSKTANNEIGPMLLKLRRRMRGRGGVRAVKATLHMLYDRKDYYGFFLYLTILYGFLEWQVPEKIVLLPAVPEVLKCYCTEFMKAMDNSLSMGAVTADEESADDEDQADI